MRVRCVCHFRHPGYEKDMTTILGMLNALRTQEFGRSPTKSVRLGVHVDLSALGLYFDAGVVERRKGVSQVQVRPGKALYDQGPEVDVVATGVNGGRAGGDVHLEGQSEGSGVGIPVRGREEVLLASGRFHPEGVSVVREDDALAYGQFGRFVGHAGSERWKTGSSLLQT